jgi:hypothetical protein
MSKLTIVTVATHNEGYLPVLEHQLKKTNINYKILGYGQKWNGWMWRTTLLIDYLKTHKPDDVVMVIDGYDVLLVGNEKDIMDKYKSFKTDIVFGVHFTKSQQYSAIVRYITHPIGKSYFNTTDEHMKNGGSFMGKAKSLINMYERIIEYSKKTGITDDQTALNNIFLNDIDHKLDVCSEIFWIWDADSVYDCLYYCIYNKLPGISCSYRIRNMRPVFCNGIQPEIIHGCAHRDMMTFVDPKLNFTIKSRDLVHSDVNDSILRRYGLIIFIIILMIMCIVSYYACIQGRS